MILLVHNVDNLLDFGNPMGNVDDVYIIAAMDTAEFLTTKTNKVLDDTGTKR